MCTLCLREEKKRKKKKPTCHFFWFKFYSRMEGRILGPKHSARLEIQGTKGTTESSSLLPMESQLGGRWRRRKTIKPKQNKTQNYTDVLVLYQLSVAHLSPTFQDLSPTQPGSHGFCQVQGHNCDSKFSWSHPGNLSASQSRNSYAPASASQASTLL